MKIIEQSEAPNPRRVRIYLAEKGIAVPYEQRDLLAKEHMAPAFKALNPLQQVPILVLDDGSVISETMAICRYFEALHPAPPLLGETPQEIAEIEMWNRRMELGLFQSIIHCFRHLHPAMAELEVPQVPAWGEANRSRAGRMLAWLNGELANRDFVAGGSFSVADITALVAMDFTKPARIDRPAELTHLWRWHAAVSGRPSAAA